MNAHIKMKFLAKCPMKQINFDSYGSIYLKSNVLSNFMCKTKSRNPFFYKLHLIATVY